MRYQLKQIYCRLWLLLGLSQKLLESHYENNYGGALRRLNAISEQLASLDFASTPGHVINGLKREELVALNSTLLHQLYFASLGGDGRPKPALAEVLARDFGSVDRWHGEFMAMGNAPGRRIGLGRAGLRPARRPARQPARRGAHPGCRGRNPILALDMYEHAYHIDFGANPKAYVDAFMRNVDWQAVQNRYEDALKVAPPRPLVQKEFGDLPASTSRKCGRCSTPASRCSSSTPARGTPSRAPRRSPSARPGATPSGCRNGWASCRRRSRWSCTASTVSTSAAVPRSRCARPASTPGT
jgi:Fe-Mn family superoxide dismutase